MVPGASRLCPQDPGDDWTYKFSLIAGAMASLPASLIVLDGEAVYCDGAGITERAEAAVWNASEPISTADTIVQPKLTAIKEESAGRCHD
jgi:hypothetical protein